MIGGIGMGMNPPRNTYPYQNNPAEGVYPQAQGYGPGTYGGYSQRPGPPPSGNPSYGGLPQVQTIQGPTPPLRGSIDPNGPGFQQQQSCMTGYNPYSRPQGPSYSVSQPQSGYIPTPVPTLPSTFVSGPQPSPQPVPQPRPQPAPQAAPQAGYYSGPQPRPQPAPQPTSQTGYYSGPQPRPQSAPYSGYYSGPQPRPQPAPFSGPQPAPQPAPYSGYYSGPQPRPQPAPFSGPQPAPQPAPQPGLGVGYPSAPHPGAIHSANTSSHSAAPKLSRFGIISFSDNINGPDSSLDPIPPASGGMKPVAAPVKAVPIVNPMATPQPAKKTMKVNKVKKEFYDLEWDNREVKPLDEREIINHFFAVSESNFYGKNKAFLAISNRRLILMTEDHRGGVYWPLATTEPLRVEVGKMLMKWSRFYFKSTVPNSGERYVQLEEKKDGAIVEALFKANLAYGEFKAAYIKNRNNLLAVFTEECNTVTRFSEGLSQCSNNISALYIWLLSVDYVLPLVRKQLKAAANEWTKSTIGNTSLDDFQMLDVIRPGSDEEQYFMQIARQIAKFFTNSTVMKQYCGAIPLLDAYYYYGKATANDLKSPEEFMKACNLLTESSSSINHIYLGTIKGKQMLCTESISFEKAESIIMESIDRGNGCVARNTLIREMGMPVGICEDIISRVEKGKKIVRDNASGDVYYYKNAFVMVSTKVIKNYKCLFLKQFNCFSFQ